MDYTQFVVWGLTAGGLAPLENAVAGPKDEIVDACAATTLSARFENASLEEK